MNSRAYRVGVGISLVASVFALGVFLVLATTKANAAGLRGVVNAHGGVEVPDALVILRCASSKQEIARSRTYDAGVFSFPTISAGAFTLEIQAANFAILRVENVRVSNGEEKSIPPVMLQLALCGAYALPQHLRLLEQSDSRAEISGTILDKRNRPVKGASLQLFCSDHRLCGDLITDAGGNYKFSTKPGEYTLRIKRSGFFDEEYGNFNTQNGFDTVYYPVYLEPCRPGRCQAWRKPIAVCQ